MINTLFISNSLDDIKSANYQIDIYDELKNYLNLSYFEIKNRQLLDHKQLYKSVETTELIIIGHYFLSDNDKNNDTNLVFDFSDIKKPIVLFLNKEYVNLKNKLFWIKKNKPVIVITHSQKFYYEYKEKINFSKLIYLPFAANSAIFKYNNIIDKDIDLSFSGILKNSNKFTYQSNLRLEIMNNIFFTIGDIPIKKRNFYNKFKIFWNSIPRNHYEYYFSRLINKYKFLDIHDYSLVLKRSKSFLNTLSPWGIVSPRYYENFFSKSLIFSENSDYLREFNKNNHIVTFNNVNEFKDKFNFYMINENQRKHIVQKAYDYALKNHSWSFRIQSLINDFKKII